MPELDQDTLQDQLATEALVHRLPLNPFSVDNGRTRYGTNWSATALQVVSALIATDKTHGEVPINPMELERETTKEFSLLRESIAKAAAETRFL